MAVTIKTKEEIKILREGGKRLATILFALGNKVVVGMTGDELEKEALRLIKEGGDTSAFLGYRTPKDKKTPAFPSALCLSINDEVVHGTPFGKTIKNGDLVSLDLGIIHGGFYTDMAITVGVGDISPEAKNLLKVTEESLRAGIKVVKGGVTTGTIGEAIQKIIEPSGFGIVRGLAGHGVGYAVHEDPFIPNYGTHGQGEILPVGAVVAIEPMVTIGDPTLELGGDGFAYKTKDGSFGAHFEHTIVVTEKGAEILTKL